MPTSSDACPASAQPGTAGGIHPQRVGDEHVRESGADEHLGLGHRGDGDADRASGDLAVRDLEAFVRLHVRAQG